MGRGQLKYRKRGGRGGGGLPSGGRDQPGRGGSESNFAAADSAQPRTERRGGGHDTSHLPSNTERWGQKFGEQKGQAHNGASSSSSKVGVQETERLLDESEWATGASSWRIGAAAEQGLDQGDWDGSNSAAAGELLSLNLGVLDVCLRSLPVHERLRLPPDYTAQLEAERQREDPALEPRASVAVPSPGNEKGAEDAASTATRGREAGATAATTSAASTPGAVVGVGDGGDDDVLDVLLGLPSAGVPSRVRGGTGASSDGSRNAGLSPALPSSRDPTTSTTTTTTPAEMQGRDRTHLGGQMAATVPGGPTDAVVKGVGRTGEGANVGTSGGGAGGDDYLEDWLDGMLAES